MSNFFKKVLSSMKLTEDTDDYDDTPEDDFQESKRNKRLDKKELSFSRYESSQVNQSSVQAPVNNDIKKERMPRMEKSSSGKVVPIRTTSKGLEVCIMKPTAFEDSQEISDMLLTGRAIVINLEGFDDKLAQRTMDFISGSVYAINGKLHRISNCIFIISPDTVDISGDYSDLIANGFEPPTFHSQF
jgi:cell division inhibitor SepF